MNFIKQVFASCLGVLLAFIAFSVLSIFVVAVAYVAAGKGSVPSVQEGSVLSISLDGVIVDHKDSESWESLLGKDSHYTGLDDLLSALQKAKKDDRIKGISLKLNSLGASYATAEEIRKALKDFKQSGKFVYAYSGLYTQGAYFVASVADSVFVNPEGSIEFSGISSSSMFVKGFLDKVGVEMQVIRCGAYKSYAESFANDTMSAENREQMQDLIDSIWDVVLDEVSADRKMDRALLAHLADEYLAVKPAAFLEANRLVDGIVYGDEYEHLLRTKLCISPKTELPLVKLEDYLAVIEDENLSWSDASTKVAVLYLGGEIDNGNTDGISSSKTISLLSELDQDSTVKAIVMRVNSPGGSAYGSEQICHTVQQVKQHKPIVVSFGDYAASGGYYISSNADKIYSNATTITGSIGVIAMVPNAQELADKLGVHYETVKTNRNADLLENVFRPLSENERGAVQASVDRFYSVFLQRCATGRNMSVDQVHVYAQGRVWSGVDAHKLNLVDSIGTLRDAIGEAAALANLSDYELASYPKKKEFWEQLEDFPAIGYEKLFGNDVFSKEKYIFEKIRNLERVQAIIPYTIELR